MQISSFKINAVQQFIHIDHMVLWRKHIKCLNAFSTRIHKKSHLKTTISLYEINDLIFMCEITGTIITVIN